MGAPDESRQPLLGDLDAEELIREARAEARANVKARLRGELERELLREVEARLAGAPAERAAAIPAERPFATPPERAAAAPERAPPAPPDPETGEGLWVYCVVRGDFAGPLGGIPGVHPEARPVVVRRRSLAAIVSRVPLAEFGEDALRRNLNDLDWLAAVARAHELVIEAALAGGPVVPMRVCTIFRGEDQIRSMLGHRASAFERSLERLAGAAEWGVKAIADRDRLTEVARARAREGASGTPEGGAGGAYLGRKREDRELRALVDALVDEALRESHARLEEWAAASELLAPQRREVADYEGEMVLNGAYLVDDDRAERFAAVVEELQRQFADDGLRFELTGPWPAFHFAGSLAAPGEPVA